MRWFKVAVALLALASNSYPAHRRNRAGNDTAGVFNYYVLVLSWSPEFCYSKPNAAECGQHKGFLVHGLWPQNSDGSYPSNCRSNQLPPTNYSSVADIMPPELVRHEWQEHGTCSGLSGDNYLGLVRRAFESIHIPTEWADPKSSLAIAPRKLKQEFEQANPHLSASDMAIQLRGRYLNAVEFCLSKSENPVPVACTNVRDAGGGTFLVPPVR